jgi:hypothetical protein
MLKAAQADELRGFLGKIYNESGKKKIWKA